MNHTRVCKQSKCVEHDMFMKKYKKLVFERYSLWEKLLKENPEDVPISLHNEFKTLLTVLEIISDDSISKGDPK